MPRMRQVSYCALLFSGISSNWLGFWLFLARRYLVDLVEPEPRRCFMNSERLGGRYQLVRLIGSGGMGSVYEGVDVATEGRVAIKLIDERAALHMTNGPLSGFSRLKREARVMKTLDT